MITKIETKNFRGQNIKRELGPVTLITGRNFAGKSTIADAVRFALAGYLPAIGKTGQALWDALAGNPQVPGEVEAKVTLSTDPDGCFARLTRDSKGSVKVLNRTQGPYELDPMILDVRTFFSLTAAERTAVVFRAAGGLDHDLEALQSELWKVEASPANVRDEIVRALTDEAVFAVEQDDKVAELERLTGEWKERLKGCKADEKKAAQEFAGTVLPAQAPNPPADVKAIQKRRDELVALRGELAALLRAQTTEGTQAGKVTEWKTELEGIVKELAELKAPDEVVAPKELEELAKLRERDVDLATQAKLCDDAKDRADDELAKLAGVTICPCCGSEGSMVKARENAENRLEQAMTALEKALSERQEVVNRIEDLAEIESAYDMRVAEREMAIDSATKQQARKTELERLIGEVESHDKNAVAIREARVAELNTAMAELPAIQQRLDREAVNAASWKNYQDALNRRNEREGKLIRVRCEMDCLAQVLKILTGLVGKWSEKAFGKVLALSRVFTDGLLNSPLEFRDGELGRCVSELDRKSGRLVPVGSWIPWRSFSGTEELLGMAAFGLALARTARFKLVVLDEFGRLDDARRGAVLERVKCLVETGAITQAILIGASTTPAPDSEGIVTINL